ncbi:MAG: hypothetical protein AB1Y25_11040 [Cycloclasticus sp.]
MMGEHWEKYDNWDAAEEAWDQRAIHLQKTQPIKQLVSIPELPAIRPKTKKNLRWKALNYLAKYDEENFFIRYFFSNPLKHGYNLLRSYLTPLPFNRDKDFFFYGLKDEDEFKTILAKPDSLLIIGFSYCHKPFECPSKRFTQDCIHDLNNPVCGQCFIGKCVHSLPAKRVLPVFITTVHQIGEVIVRQVQKHPKLEVTFLITACEMTLQMFGDWGNMMRVRGVGVRLGGQICNTMKAFVASEHGVKPGMAVVLGETKKRVLDLIRFRREQ